ncbi:uncharacterized protein LOC128243737 [Mya arenaria]|uniref:uncharacterized protein LOC128243737 n=1 Tax=Mya arenaria TaxID=6604 RepID=UPI0022E6DD8A|nr:uncharacterized protein LOC128243737 [Mya arenaria]
MDSEDMRGMSLRLSRVLGDIGVNRFIIAKRRSTWLEIASISVIMCTEFFTEYCFGSQIEGTTSPGMQSDVDRLLCMNELPVILDWSEWNEGTPNLLVINTEESPPQHCWLQRLGRDLPFQEFQVLHSSKVIDRAGKMFMTNTQLEYHDFIRAHNVLGEVVQHGPSKSWDENEDVVRAYHCASLPEECKYLFQRPRPGHWPRPNTLAMAMGTWVFLVPQGYNESPSRPTGCRSSTLHVTQDDPYYPMSKREWRFSTPMMERLLVFDWNTIQLKVYVLVKIIRKTFLKPNVGDRLSTFHIKTAMLFTIETYPSEIWRKDNIVQCVIYCLTTLRRWLAIKFCPHYTIAGVNLFTGKLLNHEFNSIVDIITSMVASNLQCIYVIEMDSIGARMSALRSGVRICETMSRDRNNLDISSFLTFTFFKNFQELLDLRTDNQNALEYGQFILLVSESIETFVHKTEQGTALEREAAAVLISSFRCKLATAQASCCIKQGQPITQDIFNIYQQSLDSDLSGRLKFTSMCFSSGQYEAAANNLMHCKGLLGSVVWQECYCTGRQCLKPISNNKFIENNLKKSNMEILTKHTILCISFSRHEMYCIPQFLVYEMFRTISEEDTEERCPPIQYEWMDLVVVDCIPFLHYLNVLTYMQLNQHDRALDSLQTLKRNCFDHGHFDTTLNMIGHCYELVNRLDKAWMYYGKSLQLYPKNNAAKWHVGRLLHQKIKFRHCGEND